MDFLFLIEIWIFLLQYAINAFKTILYLSLSSGQALRSGTLSFKECWVGTSNFHLHLKWWYLFRSRDTLGRSVLHIAASLGKTDICNWLLTYKVKLIKYNSFIDSRRWQTLFKMCCLSCNLSIIYSKIFNKKDRGNEKNLYCTTQKIPKSKENDYFREQAWMVKIKNLVIQHYTGLFFMVN